MPLNAKNATVVRLVAEGSTLAEVARKMDLSTSRVKQILVKGCRVLGLPPNVEFIRADPQAYLSALPGSAAVRASGLRHGLQRDLMSVLNLKTVDQLSPELVSNLSASQLIDCSFTSTAVANVQAWLTSHGLRLAQSPTVRTGELRALESALQLLDAYRFDITAARAQLEAERAPPA